MASRGYEVARGILQAIDTLTVRVPFVVRLVGTNEEEGRRILAEANLITATSLADALRRRPLPYRTIRRRIARLIEGAARMSILVGKDTRLVVQGITGREGLFHTQQMVETRHQRCGRRYAGQGWRVGVFPHHPRLRHSERSRGGA